MYVAGWLCFSALEKWPSVGDVLCVLALHFPLVSQCPVASWLQVSVWLVFADSVCRLQDCGFLASGVCPLMGEAGLEVCAGFLVGGARACPLMGGARS